MLQNDIALSKSSGETARFRLRDEEGGGTLEVPLRSDEGHRVQVALERIVRELRSHFTTKPGDVVIQLRPKLYTTFLWHMRRDPNGEALLVPEVPFYSIVIRSTEWPIYSRS